MKPTREPETGYPLLPAQRPLAVSRLTDDETGVCVVECIVLPNLLLYFDSMLNDGKTRLGECQLISVPVAREIAEKLPHTAEGATECDCEKHEGRSMTMLDLEENL